MKGIPNTNTCCLFENLDLVVSTAVVKGMLMSLDKCFLSLVSMSCISQCIELQWASLLADPSSFFVLAVISPASWREGQKRVKMILGPGPKSTQDDRSQLQRGFVRTGKCLISLYRVNLFKGHIQAKNKNLFILLSMC